MKKHNQKNPSMVSPHANSHLPGLCSRLHEVLMTVKKGADVREEMVGHLNKVASHYEREYNTRIHARQHALITRYTTRQQEAQKEEVALMEDEEDIDLLELDFEGFRTEEDEEESGGRADGGGREDQ